ncbi:MAG TPA: hypothetical protein PKD12_02780 [Nitrospira sp.]|nr:hypothetical protein [Nitrospira sp.]
MMSFTCRDLTPDFIQSWVDERLDSLQQDVMRVHLRECPACSQTVTRTVSKELWGFLTGEGRDLVPAFLDEVSNILQSAADSSTQTTGLAKPLVHALQKLLAETRDILWPRSFGLAGTPAMATLSGDGKLSLQEVNEAGQAVGTPLSVSEDDVIQGPVLTKEGRFQFRLKGTEPHFIGKRLICTIQLIEEQQAVSLQTTIGPSSTTSGWEAVFDEELLTDPALLSNREYRVPFDYLQLLVEPRATTLQG